MIWWIIRLEINGLLFFFYNFKLHLCEIQSFSEPGLKQLIFNNVYCVWESKWTWMIWRAVKKTSRWVPLYCPVSRGAHERATVCLWAGGSPRTTGPRFICKSFQLFAYDGAIIKANEKIMGHTRSWRSVECPLWSLHRQWKAMCTVWATVSCDANTTALAVNRLGRAHTNAANVLTVSQWSVQQMLISCGSYFCFFIFFPFIPMVSVRSKKSTNEQLPGLWESSLIFFLAK